MLLGVLEALSSKFFVYLDSKDIINLCFVLKSIRKIISKVFDHILFINTGFCSTRQWFNLIEKNCFALIEGIYSNFF